MARRRTSMGSGWAVRSRSGEALDDLGFTEAERARLLHPSVRHQLRALVRPLVVDARAEDDGPGADVIELPVRRAATA